jgi:hypothetical protein
MAFAVASSFFRELSYSVSGGGKKEKASGGFRGLLDEERRGANTSHFTSTRLNIYCRDKT